MVRSGRRRPLQTQRIPDMSLIRVRRRRKKSWIDQKKGSSPKKLVILLLAVLAVIWYLSARF